MLDLVATTQFRKDLKKLRKRGADIRKLDTVLQTLCAEKCWTRSIGIMPSWAITSVFVNVILRRTGCSSMPSTRES